MINISLQINVYSVFDDIIQPEYHIHFYHPIIHVPLTNEAYYHALNGSILYHIMLRIVSLNESILNVTHTHQYFIAPI